MSHSTPDTVRDESASSASERLEHPWLGRILSLLAIVVAFSHIYFNTLGTVSEIWVSALHFGMFGLLCALSVPMFKARSASGQRLLLAVDVCLGVSRANEIWQIL